MSDQLASYLDGGADELRRLVRSSTVPGTCADLLVAALVTDPDERQSLLETLDPADRIDAALDHVGRLLVQLGAAADMPN